MKLNGFEVELGYPCLIEEVQTPLLIFRYERCAIIVGEARRRQGNVELAEYLLLNNNARLRPPQVALIDLITRFSLNGTYFPSLSFPRCSNMFRTLDDLAALIYTFKHVETTCAPMSQCELCRIMTSDIPPHNFPT